VIIMRRTYSELIRYATFDERFNYLKLHGHVAGETFGADRYLNQKFYHSKEWKELRQKIILRDNGCDLGFPGYEIHGNIYVHHINPLTIDDLSVLFTMACDPENLICVSYETHNAIHYGTEEYLKAKNIADRTPNDTCPWRNR